jgi:hypothetical protein
MKNLNRRKFVNNISIGAVIAFVYSLIPSVLLPNDRKIKITVKNHPKSVKRNK